MSDRLFDDPKETKAHPAGMGGVQRLYEFDNGFRASLIRTRFSYGGSEGFWELAVLDASGKLTYDTPITDDVVGWLDEDAAEALLQQIATLPGTAK